MKGGDFLGNRTLKEMERLRWRWDYRVALIYDDSLPSFKAESVVRKYRAFQKTWVLQFKCGRLMRGLIFQDRRL